MTTQEKATEMFTAQTTKNFEMVADLTTKNYAQAEKSLDFFAAQSQEIAEETQKVAKEWMDAGKAATEDFVKAYQTQLQDAFKMFVPTV